MMGLREDLTTLRREIAESGATATTQQERAQNGLEVRGRVVPFDTAWLTVRDPEQRRHTPLASAGPVEPLHRYFLTPDADAEVEELGEICEAAGMLWAATAGVVLSRGGETLPLPGLPDHRLLTRGSPIVTAAARELANSCTHTSFLAPVPADDQQGLVRVTALDCARPDLDDLSAAVLLSAPGNLRGLGTLKLLVLGHVIDGRTTVPAIAAALGMATTKVRDALAATVSALSAPNLTAAAVQALRTGLWIPPQLAPA